MRVAVVMGSTSDLVKLVDMIDFLKKYDIQVDVRALSAHRAHDALASFIEDTKTNGTEVIIAAAGKAAHLPGVIAAMTTSPVIGVPIKGSALDGMDALLSIVQMPAGIPVATVAIDGSMNAGILAMQMMAIKHDNLKAALIDYKTAMTNSCLAANEKLMEEYK
ncbi:5-(carboxyamino)imidazole ribonucleotide mutase [Tannockella kyphosi]|uniref:5-(carboxyamino)imidazole ribonucleotide mutase n=1 Tax=Tannockella kyphosi TaxID=2899121 RepID=UPI002010E187|nr:5-(carboxyamino)imidazole ribonucleotide mutase [Tannockella kyphosi]